MANGRLCRNFSRYRFCGYRPLMWGRIVRSLNQLTVKEASDFIQELVFVFSRFVRVEGFDCYLP
ncbi:MAG: hypothetical protein M1330_02170, partial [Armatimonadetes bacterium]|nr:hypothetical protein [Armatimonadota bacterium]